MSDEQESDPYKPKRPAEWRKNIRDAMKEPTEAKLQIFLDEIRKHGRIGQSFREAGVCGQTIQNRVKEDKEFADAYEQAKKEYASLIQEISFGQINGIKEVLSKLKDGAVTSKTTLKFPSNPLLQMELKRVNKEYVEKQEIDLDVKIGGTLVVPRSDTNMSNEDWIKNNTRPAPDSSNTDSSSDS